MRTARHAPPDPHVRWLSLILYVVAFFTAFALLTAFVRADPADAVIRIPSHGASATVIQTEPGRTLILGCAHAYADANRGKAMVLDVPHHTPTSPKRVGAPKLLALDYQRDLSLVELLDGPLPYVCPVASADHFTRGPLLSVGYDEMRVPATKKRATPLGTTGQVTWTAEIPWHGRSGGALIDGGELIGVVQGYEVGGESRGMYVSLQTIHAFLRTAQRPTPQPIDRSPYLTPGFGPRGFNPRPDCPDGRCPLQR